MLKQFLDSIGLSVLTEALSKYIAPKHEVLKVKEETDPYILDIDYSFLEFDTSYIVPSDDDASSPTIGVGKVNSLIIAKS